MLESQPETEHDQDKKHTGKPTERAPGKEASGHRFSFWIKNASYAKICAQKYLQYMPFCGVLQ